MPRLDGDGGVDRAATAERDARIIEMRKAGLTYREIAETLGMEIGTVHAAFRRGIATIPKESAEELTTLVIGRLDYVTRQMMRVMNQFHPVVNTGKVVIDPETGGLLDDPLPKIAAAKIVVGVLERTARLYGLDAPRTTVQITVDALDAEIRKLEQELGTDLPRGDGGLGADTHQREREIPAIEAPKHADRPPGWR